MIKKITTKLYKKIIKSPEYIIFFTDGSSLLREKAKGGYYIQTNIDLPFAKILTENVIPASNNRAELTAFILAFQELAASHNELNQLKNLEIVFISDSLYSLNCLNYYRELWFDKKKPKKNIKNLDLIQEAYFWHDFVEFELNKKIKFYHINSHTKKPSDKKSTEYKLWSGNDKIDKLVKISKN